MKYSVLAVLSLLVACGPNRDEEITKLIQEKKITEDSLRIVSAIEMDFQSKAKANRADSTIFLSLIDSSTYYYREIRKFNMRLDKIEFSIDSLSTLK